MQAMLKEFATTYSEGVQDSMYRMGMRALEAVPEISQISMALPNLHYIPMNLSPFKLDNPGVVFLPTNEPHGQIQCTVGFARFQELNTAYKKKFGFPFIMAVRGSNKKAILDGFVERLGNAPDEEFDRALGEIEKIARFRVQELVQG